MVLELRVLSSAAETVVSEIVIAKTSSNYKYNSELQWSKDMHVAMFRSIAKHINSDD